MRTSFDAIVVGAGIAGTATAYYLTKAGLKICLVDAISPGGGASGRNPGFLWLQTKSAGPQMQFSLAGRHFADTLTQELGEFGFRASGGLIIYRDEALEPLADAFAADRRDAGLPAERIGRNALRELCPHFSDAVRGAVWNPLDAHQDTRRLLAQFVMGAQRAGMVLRCGSRVARLVIESDRCRGIDLESGDRLSADRVVLAGGQGSGSLLEAIGLDVKFTIYKFEAAETEPAPFRVDPVVCGQALFRFFKPPGVTQIPEELSPKQGVELLAPSLGFTEQIAQYPDGRVQFGCSMRTGTTDDRPTVAGQAMGAAINALNLPGLANLSIERCWAGIVAQTADGMPIVDADPGIEGLALNTGHFFGNLAGAISGQLIADLMLRTTPVVDPAPLALKRLLAA